MRKVVLDTNVLVSALWSNQGNPYKILEMFFQGEIMLYYNHEIMDEYSEVLHREKLGFPKNKVRNLLNEIMSKAVFAESPKSKMHFIDESDRKFFDLAKYYEARLITGNTRHYPSESCVVTPHEFLKDSSHNNI
ncbi:MAG: putative toxin-antitoxin system toxin component, PIN family [Clostridiales bacterium]|nr:putative toxin-antitoxin system toxin component, PIN family [Clostridiales bacterium]